MIRGHLFAIFFIIVLFASANIRTFAYAQSANLIQNGSLETAGTGAPFGWSSDYWGSPVPVFSYPAVGNAGTKGASITLNANSTGDAHWQGTTITVTPGTQYTYSLWYNSNVATEIDAEYTNSAGAISYVWLADVPSSVGAWKSATVTFTVPSGMTRANVYLLLFNKGTVTIDDVSLVSGSTTPPPPPPAAPTLALSASPSAITVGQSSTLSWTSSNTTNCTATNGWTGAKALSGTQSVSPTATTTYALTCIGAGGTTTQQVIVGVSPAPVTPPPQASLTFSATPITIVSGQSSTLTWTSSNTTSCTASGGWTGAKAVSGSQVVTLTATTTYNLSCTGAGGTIAKQLTIGVTPPPATTNPNQFTEGMVTLSFDDAWASQYTNALPILQASGLPATFYLISSVIQNNANFPGYMTPAMATTIANAGHEIADHTITHSDLTTLSSAQVTNEITASRTYLQNLTGKTITSLAYPYGSVNTTVKNLTKQAGYVSARGVDDSQLNTPSSDKYNLFGQCVDSTVTLATIKASIDQAKANKQWYILCLHEIATTGDQYTISPSQLQQIITYIKQVGIKTVTVQQGRALML